MQDRPRILVCQRGNRHRYAVPRLFEEAGMLAALYTDSSIFSRAGRLARLLKKIGINSARIEALNARVLSNIPHEKCRSSDHPLLSTIFPKSIRGDLAPIYKKWGLQGADAIYSMYGEDFEFLSFAKQKGLKIIIDVFVHPGANRTVARERQALFSAESVDDNLIAEEDKHSRKLFNLADILLCPSEWVAQGVQDFTPQHAGKIRIIPYGSSLKLAGSTRSPASGRLLFTGRDTLRKGLHYFAEAVHIVRENGHTVEARVAGVRERDISWIRYKSELNCLGSIQLDQMYKEYGKAELFVLPSLTEGQAGVILEAMACGCPVIATKESGVDFMEGAGVVVPARDAGALAEEIGRILSDKALRDSLSRRALEQSKSYSIDAWKDNLVKVVEDVVQT